MPTSRPTQASDRPMATPDAAISARVSRGAGRPSRGVQTNVRPDEARRAPQDVPDWLKPHERPSRPRRSPKLIAIGILCACLGGLGAAFAWTSMTTAVSVIVVQRAVSQGDTIVPGDFGVADVSVSTGVATMPAAKLPSLIGQQALVDLPIGTLVGPAAVGELSVSADDSVIGISVGPSHAPVDVMPYGTKVILFQVVDGDAAEPPPWTAQGEVVTTSVTNPDGTVLVDVALPADQALRAASLAAQNKLAIVRMGG